METIASLGEFINTATAAELLGIAPQTLRYRVTRGYIQPVNAQRGTGFDMFFCRAEIERLAAEWAANSPGSRPASHPDLITAPEAAKILGLTKSGLGGHVRSGNLIPQEVLQPGGRQSTKWLFWRQDVERRRDNVPPMVCPPYTKNPTHDETVYFAGLFDGEGSVIINRVPRRNRPGAPDQYHLRISLANTWHPAISRLAVTFGGSVVMNKPGKPGYRPVLHWSASTVTAYHILKLWVPYLDCKRVQALLAIEFHDRLIAYNARWRGGVDPDEFAWRVEQRAKMLKLNERGKFIPEDES